MGKHHEFPGVEALKGCKLIVKIICIPHYWSSMHVIYRLYSYSFQLNIYIIMSQKSHSPTSPCMYVCMYVRTYLGMHVCTMAYLHPPQDLITLCARSGYRWHHPTLMIQYKGIHWGTAAGESWCHRWSLS